MSVASKLNFDIRLSSQVKFDAEKSVSAEKLMSLSMSSSSLSSAEDILMSNSKQMIIYMFLFLKSEMSEALYFSRTDVTEFLH